MAELLAVRLSLLELGLEDWIPLPEAVERVRGSGSQEPEREVREVLIALGREGRIRFWRGAWDREAEHVEVSTHEAEHLLEDPRWYRFHADEPSEERFYFVNVDNIAGDAS